MWSLRIEGLLGPLMGMLPTAAIRDLEVDEPRLEDVLIRYYREGAQ
jgi:hypothetical protein